MKSRNKKHFTLSLLFSCASMLLASNVSHAQSSEGSDTDGLDNIEFGCENSYGECFVVAEDEKESGAHTTFMTECNCQSGEGWALETLSNEGRKVNVELAQEACNHSLEQCTPPNTPQPSGFQIYRDEQISSRHLECSREAVPNKVDATCHVRSGQEWLDIQCECAGTSFGHSAEPDPTLFDQELHQLCLQEMTTCDRISDEGPEDPDEGEDGNKDVEDVLDALGCSLSNPGTPSPFSLGGGLILLAGLLRRKE